jgi:hypothetical protein
LTQLLSEKDEEGNGPLENVEGIVGEGDYWGAEADANENLPRCPSAKDEEGRAASIIPQTPTHKRIEGEIPSSQPTPFTPSPKLERDILARNRSPLRHRCTNADAPMRIAETVRRRPHTSVIQDSCSASSNSLHSDTARSHTKVTPTRRSIVPLSSPELRETTDNSGQDGEAGKDEDEVLTASANSPSPDAETVYIEIADSDEDGVGSAGPTPQKAAFGPLTPERLGNAGKLNAATDTPSRSSGSVNGLPTESPARAVELAIPTTTVRRVQTVPPPPSSEGVHKEPPRSSPKQASPEHVDVAQAKSQFFTQGLESQRVPLEVIHSMGPRTDRSDIIISIHPGPVEKIVNGTKSHEFRNYRIPVQVSRIWIYVTKPVCELRYMAIIGPAKQPGEIPENGIGNAEFNRGEMTKFAHELLQVYELNNPVSIQVMKENGWVEGPPQKYVYIPPAVVGQLLGNLRCALFADHPEAASPNPMASQKLPPSREVEAQPRRGDEQATRNPWSQARENEIIPSSYEPTPQPRASFPVKGTDDLFTRPIRPARPQINRTHVKETVDSKMAGPSQTTTASEPSISTISAQKSVPRPISGSSIPSLLECVEEDSPINLPLGLSSFGSSQPLLPESMLNDESRQPPEIWDSDDDELD